jgi:hypothetical protein
VTVLALASVRSCGVTTLAVALAATWPAGRRVLLAELDPAGATLAAGSGWPPEPGLVSLAAASRRGGDPGLVWDHCQELPGGVAVLAGPASTEHARTALGMLGPLLARLGELDGDVVADCGRLEPGGPGLGLGVLAGAADRVVLVARPRLADLHALATWREDHPLDAPSIGLVLVGDGPYPDDEIAGALGVEVLARLPWDPAAAEGLLSVPASARELRFAPLTRAARTLADRLTAGPTGPVLASPSEPAAPEAGRLRTRVLRAWHPASAAPAANGNAPEGVGR